MELLGRILKEYRVLNTETIPPEAANEFWPLLVEEIQPLPKNYFSGTSVTHYSLIPHSLRPEFLCYK